MATKKSDTQELTFNDFKSSVLRDYKIACESREMSLMGRREVLSGKGSFGIFGDGKELAQIALARCFKKGDFRSGYYRDQTLMMALGELTVQQFFAALYGHADIDAEPQSGGRQMVAHFSTQSLNEDGSWKNLTEQYNSASDISCTSGQMPRLVGLAQASKVFRENKLLKEWTIFLKMEMKLLGALLVMPQLQKDIFLKPLMLPVYCKYLWLFPFGTMVMVFLYIVNIKPLKKIFLKF